MNIDNEFAWRNELRKLGGDAQPQRDLWPRIAARIACSVQSSRASRSGTNSSAPRPWRTTWRS